MFINKAYINELLEEAKGASKEEVDLILDKASKSQGLSHKDIAVLLQCDDKDQLNRMYQIAGEIKRDRKSVV